MQYAHKKWNLHGTEKNGSPYQMFHFSTFRENGSITNKKRKSEKKKRFMSLFLLIWQALFEL